MTDRNTDIRTLMKLTESFVAQVEEDTETEIEETVVEEDEDGYTFESEGARDYGYYHALYTEEVAPDEFDD